MYSSDQNGRPEPLRRAVADVFHDVADLGELQWELLIVDATQARRKATAPLAALLAAAAVALGVVFVLLLGLAELLVLYAGFPTAWAYLLVAAVAGVAAAVSGIMALKRLQSSLSCFARSRDELKENIQWMRRVIKARDRSQLKT